MFELLKNDSLTLDDTFTAAYNAIRVLQYRNRITKSAYAEFLKQHEATSSDKVISVSLKLIKEIEKHENTPVSKLDNKLARKYEITLASLAERRARQEVGEDPKKAKQLLKQLKDEISFAP